MLPKLINGKITNQKEPKIKILTLRMSENDMNLLNIISKQTSKTKTQLFNQALRLVLDEESADLGSKTRLKLKGD